MEDAAAVDMRDRAATRAQRVNVEARECDLRDADCLLARERGLAVLQERDVRARPAHVERDQIFGRQQLDAVATRRHAARGSRQHGARGEALRFRDRRDAPV